MIKISSAVLHFELNIKIAAGWNRLDFALEKLEPLFFLIRHYN